MTKEQIEKKALKAYPKMSMISEPHGVIPADTKSRYLGDANEKARDAYIKALTEIEELPKIKGWVARDKADEHNSSCCLAIFDEKPDRDELNNCWCVETNGVGGTYINLPSNMFPDLKWEDEPLEVELIIHPYSKNNE